MMTLQVLHYLHRHHDHLVLESLDAACWAVLRLAQPTNLNVQAPYRRYALHYRQQVAHLSAKILSE